MERTSCALHGVKVVEYASDYSVPSHKGRSEAESDPTCHFIDDENSVNLFLHDQMCVQDLGIDGYYRSAMSRCIGCWHLRGSMVPQQQFAAYLAKGIVPVHSLP
mgnify:CR=1 FL=1